MTNEERRNRAAQILESFGSEHQDDEENITDIIADLLILAASQGTAIDALARRCVHHAHSDILDEEEPEEDEDDQPTANCPQCGSYYNTLLGSLGHIQHFRCRLCGAQHSRDMD